MSEPNGPAYFRATRLLNCAAREVLLRGAPRATKVIASHWGSYFPFWYVSEYPRSGGTWLGRILATYLDIPFPQENLGLLALPSVIHNHWKYDPRLERVFYLYRDGRDVMTSLYFMRMQMIKSDLGRTVLASQLDKRYRRILGADYLRRDARANLPGFIESEMLRPRQSPLNWPDHVRSWKPATEGKVVFLSYEDLLRDPHGVLSRALNRFDQVTDNEQLADAIERRQFVRASGRRAGEEDRTDLFTRKGVAGDWLNHFSIEAVRTFDHFAGDVLISLGYERDRDWPSQYAGLTA